MNDFSDGKTGDLQKQTAAVVEFNRQNAIILNVLALGVIRK